MNANSDNQYTKIGLIFFGSTVTIGYLFMKFYKYMKYKQIKDSKDELQDPTNIKDVVQQECNSARNINGAEREYLEFTIVKKLFKEITHMTIDIFMRGYKYVEENREAFKSEENIKIFKNDILMTLERNLIEYLHLENISPQVFFTSYYHYCKLNESFKIKAQYLSNLKIEFLGSQGVSIKFPAKIEENFLKIVTNIFFHTAYLTWVDFKKDFLDKKNSSDKDADIIYQKHLKDVRRKVYQFFEVPKSKELASKYLVRLYPHSLSKTHPVRDQYSKVSEQINLYLDNLNRKIIPTIFLTHNDETKFEIEDKILDLDLITTGLIDYNQISN